MTLPSLSKLTPEQVNRMCAEAMGCTPVKDYHDVWRDAHGNVYSERELPKFATDSAAALALCDALGNEGIDTSLFYDCDIHEWQAHFKKGTIVVGSIWHQSLHLAIARAYLLAKNLATE